MGMLSGGRWRRLPFEVFLRGALEFSSTQAQHSEGFKHGPTGRGFI